MSARAWAIVGLLALVGAGAGAWLWQALEQRGRAEAERAVAESALETRRKEIATVRERLAAAEKPRGEPPGATGGSEKAKVAAKPVEAKRATETWAEFIRGASAAQKDPAWQLKQLNSLRARTGDRYGILYRAAGWSSDRTRAFEDNYMKREEHHMDLNAAAQAQGIDLSDPAIVKMRGEIYREYEKAQRALLGDAGYAQLEDYERTSSLRDIVRAVGGAATVEGTPITSEQAEAVVRVLANASESYRQGKPASATNVDWAAAERELAGVLSDAQLAFFRSVEAPGGVFHARWGAELNKAMAAERKRKAGGK
ncbi:MAG: hypothetical protein V4773_31155 [Verrucomicrobiota bacterium]